MGGDRGGDEKVVKLLVHCLEWNPGGLVRHSDTTRGWL